VRRRSVAHRLRGAFIEESDTIRPVKPDTIAKSLAIGNPADGLFSHSTPWRNSGGGFLVGHRRGRSSRAWSCSHAPRASSPKTAGGRHYRDAANNSRRAAVVRPDECVVVYITGHGLKTIEAVAPYQRPDRNDRAEPRRVSTAAFDIEEG